MATYKFEVDTFALCTYEYSGAVVTYPLQMSIHTKTDSYMSVFQCNDCLEHVDVSLKKQSKKKAKTKTHHFLQGRKTHSGPNYQLGQSCVPRLIPTEGRAGLTVYSGVMVVLFIWT